MGMLVGVGQAANIEVVTVGNPGNVGEQSRLDFYSDTTYYGGVDYVYSIGKYEVTAGQYTEFLNAVADDDTYGLYNSKMWSSDFGCKIQQSGSSGSFSYSVAGNREDRPVSDVSWGGAARFSNWLHNGQPTGAQDLTTTEDGAYYLNGATSDAALMAVTREADATWCIPTENEWYKAAYYDSDTNAYFDYPTDSDSAPGNKYNPDPGNNANIFLDDYVIGYPYYTSEVGEFENSASPYGTFDQGGNVGEWNETAIDSFRGLRGGWYGNDEGSLHSRFRGAVRPMSDCDI